MAQEADELRAKAALREKEAAEAKKRMAAIDAKAKEEQERIAFRKQLSDKLVAQQVAEEQRTNPFACFPASKEPPPPNHNLAVEAFLKNNPVDANAAQQLVSLPWELQHHVIIRGAFAGARDQSAVMLSRIKDGLEGKSVPQQAAPPPAQPSPQPRFPGQSSPQPPPASSMSKWNALRSMSNNLGKGIILDVEPTPPYVKPEPVFKMPPRMPEPEPPPDPMLVHMLNMQQMREQLMVIQAITAAQTPPPVELPPAAPAASERWKSLRAMSGNFQPGQRPEEPKALLVPEHSTKEAAAVVLTAGMSKAAAKAKLPDAIPAGMSKASSMALLLTAIPAIPVVPAIPPVIPPPDALHPLSKWAASKKLSADVAKT